MRKIKDAVVVTGKYTNNQGEEKKRYMTIGALFERDDKSVALKLEAIPLGFDGWVNFYDPKISQAKKEIGQTDQVYAPKDQFEDEIPF